MKFVKKADYRFLYRRWCWACSSDLSHSSELRFITQNRNVRNVKHWPVQFFFTIGMSNVMDGLQVEQARVLLDVLKRPITYITMLV